uniref:Uncharacterized protein n=1 Tax=Hyaloperonospora arabidopsidis (strain Emoy2) TaxID=559515 RepID=M4BMJ6_HYAAE
MSVQALNSKQLPHPSASSSSIIHYLFKRERVAKAGNGSRGSQGMEQDFTTYIGEVQGEFAPNLFGVRTVF